MLRYFLQFEPYLGFLHCHHAAVFARSDHESMGWAGVVEHRPLGGKWRVEFKEIIHAAAKTPLDHIRRHIMATQCHTKFDTPDGELCIGQ